MLSFEQILPFVPQIFHIYLHQVYIFIKQTSLLTTKEVL